MSICKKGFSLETKTCKDICKFCIEYVEGNKKERAKKEREAFKVWISEYIKTANPNSCEKCKLYTPEDYEGGGWTYMARCQALNKSFEPLKHGQTHKKLVGCPFKENNNV